MAIAKLPQLDMMEENILEAEKTASPPIFTWGAKAPIRGSSYHANILMDGKFLIHVTSWAWHSCAAGGLDGFSFVPLWNNRKKVDQLLEWLGTHQLSSYNSREYHFLLSSIQKKSKYYDAFIKHPKVRLIDAYSNKAHTGNLVYVYRLSLNEDFNDSAKLRLHAPKK
jgi:hypothetical protein